MSWLARLARALRQGLSGFVGPTSTGRDPRAVRRALERRAGLRQTCC
jgi:hypothetical protein